MIPCRHNRPLFEHKWVWMSTLDGGGYWICMNENCGETLPDGTGHNGG